MLQVSEKEVLHRLEFDNPWWKTGQNVGGKIGTYPRRLYFPPFYKLVTDTSVNRAVILMGPRRVGKTVMVYHAIQNLISSGIPGNRILYLSLETPLYSGLSLEHITNLFRQLFQHAREDQLFIFFDEIQYLKDWEIHLKSLVDSYSAYRFIATGSAAAALRLKSQESGAGRFTDFLLPPLTFAEYLLFIKRDEELLVLGGESEEGVSIYQATDIEALNAEFINYLNYGGYPEAVFSELLQQDNARYIKSDIIDKVLLRDLPSLYGISDIQELNRLFTTLAYNTGNEITLESLSQSAGVAKNTLKRYLEYLEAAFLIKRVSRIDHTARHFKRATSFKVYLTNPSMRAALFGNITADSEFMGTLTETAIFSQWLHSDYINNLYYARWDGGEVDIVSVSSSHQKPLWVVEVKWSDRPADDRSLLDNCVSFVKKNGIDQIVLVTTKTKTAELIYRDIRFILQPSSAYAYTVGANILDGKNSFSLLSAASSSA